MASIYEDENKLEKEAGDGRTDSPADYVYVPNAAVERKLVRKIDFVSQPSDFMIVTS